MSKRFAPPVDFLTGGIFILKDDISDDSVVSEDNI